MLKQISEFDFYLITCSSISKKGIVSDVKNAVDAGCKFVQYREKNKRTEEMIKEANQLKEICDKRAIFIVDDNVDVAYSVNADGVHIGQDDVPVQNARFRLGENKIIGLTVHNVDEALKAQKQDVDYIGLAPIFKTDTKEDSGTPCGPEMIKKVKEKVNLPIIAIGGINKDNVHEVISKGADGVVAVSAVLDSEDVFREVSDFIRIIKEAKD